MKTTVKVALGYLIISVVGFLFLSIPLFQIQSIHWIDNLFISISSVSTTGLIPLQIIDNYNFGGQLIILILIQIGGIGYMSFMGFILYRLQHHWKPSETNLLKNDLGLPHNYNFIQLLKVKMIMALIIETIGAIVLGWYFVEQNVENPIWNGIFHSISAFCTAGISLFPNGIENYTTHTGISLTLAILCFLGSVGFVVFADVWQKLNGKRKVLTFTSRIILKYSLILISIGTVLFFTLEPSIQKLNTYDKILVAIFHTISASSTAGFNTISFSLLSIGNLFLLCLLMVIGASPTGTGGGLKLTTFTIILAHLKSSFQGLNKVVLQNTLISNNRVRMALTTFTFYAISLALFVLFLTYLHPKEEFEKILFEVISALSTVGLTMGLTFKLGLVGKILLSIAMFIGRIGFVTFGLVLFSERHLSKNIKSKDLAT